MSQAIGGRRRGAASALRRARQAYVEEDVAGRTSVAWDAVRVTRIEAGLPICGHKDCEIPLDVDKYRSVVWYAEAAWDVLANGEHAARDLYKSLLFSVAGLVAEVRIARYPPPAYVEKDATGFAIVPWLAARVARLEAGLTICGHKDCDIPFDAERIAAVTKRAEDEAFVLLKANWAIVKRLANALCRRDRLTTTELDALLGPAPTR